MTASCSSRHCFLSLKASDVTCAFGVPLWHCFLSTEMCGVTCSAFLLRVRWLSFLSAINTFNHSLARYRSFLCSTCCFPQLGSSRIVNSRALNSAPGNCLHSCLDNLWGVATGQGTSHSFSRYLMCSPHSLCNRSFGDGSSHALVNLCGCWQFWGHQSKCTLWHFHPMEGLWYFNQSVPKRMLSFPRLVMNIWTCSVCILPCW